MTDLWRYIVAGMAAALLMAAIVGAAVAEPVCRDRKQLEAFMYERFKEVPIQRGIAAGGLGIVEVFASAGGSWTLVFTNGQMQACPMASGDGWEAMPLVAKGDPA